MDFRLSVRRNRCSFIFEKCLFILRFQGFGDLVNVQAVSHGREDPVVGSLPVEKLLVNTAFHGPALFQHHNVGGINDLGDAMGNDNDRPVGFYGIQAFFDLLRGDGVEAGGGLIQKYDRRVFKKQPRYGDPLLLSARKRARIRLVALGQLYDLIVDIRFFSCFFHFAIGGFRLAVTDIFSYGAFENMVFLQYQPDVLPQFRCVVIGQVYAVYENLAPGGFIELIQEIHNGAFSGPAEPYQGCGPVGRYGHTHVEERLGAVRINEVHIFQFNFTFYFFRNIGSAVFDLVIRFQDVEEAFGVDQCIVYLIVDPVKLPDRGRDVPEEHNMEHNCADGHSSVKHKPGRQDNDDHHTHLFDQAFDTVEDKSRFASLQLVIGHVMLNDPVLFRFRRLLYKRLDHRNRLDQADDAVVFGFPEISHLPPEAAQLAGLILADIEVNGYNAKADHTDPEISRKHGDQRHNGVGKQGKYINEKVLNQSGEAADAGIDTGLELTALVFNGTVKGQTIGEDLFHDRLGKVAGNEDPEPFTIIFLTELHHGVHHFLYQQDAADHRKQGKSFAQRLFGDHQVRDGIYRKTKDVSIHLCCK